MGALEWLQSLQNIFQNLITCEVRVLFRNRNGWFLFTLGRAALRTPCLAAWFIEGQFAHTSMSVLCWDPWRLLSASRGLRSGSVPTRMALGQGLQDKPMASSHCQAPRRAGVCAVPAG